MVRMQRQHAYARVGLCIYCGGVADSDEHIIPRSLGGMLTLPASSCGACRDLTSAVEGRLAASIFAPVRRQFRFPTRHPKRTPAPFSAEIDGVPTVLEDNDFPGMLLAFTFSPPSVLGLGPPATEHLGGGIDVKILPGFGDRLNRIQRGKANELKFTGSTVDTTQVGRLLAKIAHSYAMAELGVEAFNPLLLDIIKDKNATFIGQYVGDAMAFNNPGTDLHEIDIDPFFERHRYVVVRVRLFANYGLPTYWVVVGERRTARGD